MHTRPFHQQTAIVTGAAQGIGFEICKQLLLAGSSVVVNDIDESLLDQSIRKLRQTGGNCIPFPGDASDLGIIKNMIAKTVEQFGRLDIAIANAGITLFGDFNSYTESDFYNVLRVNLGGSFFLAQQTSEQIKKQGGGGSILLMSSVTGHQAHKNLSAYAMTKAAIEMLAKSLVVELSEFSININAIAPGATITERTAQDAGYAKTWSSITPMGRAATTEDIANAALFLVSKEARHITGQSLVIDGGWTSVSPSPY